MIETPVNTSAQLQVLSQVEHWEHGDLLCHRDQQPDDDVGDGPDQRHQP